MSKILLPLLMVLSAFPGVSSPSAQAADEADAAATFPMSCYATTFCYSPYRPPYTIACQAYGQGCTWWVVPNHSVQCTGFDAWGRWVNYYFRCWP